MTITQRLAKVKHIALDMDGTIYRGGTLFEFTKPFLATLESLGIGHTFLTNNSSKSVEDYRSHLMKMGIGAGMEQIYTSTHATIAHLRRALPGVRTLFALGTRSMQNELEAAGFEIVQTLPTESAIEPDALVVGFDTAMTYPRLCAAAYWAAKGKPYVASHPDPFCPTDLPTVLVDCGAVCDCIASATGRRPDAVVGKPDPFMLRDLMSRHHLQPQELVMAGDRLTTDIAMARAAGTIGVLVLTGVATAEDARTAVEPADLVVADLGELGELIRSAKGNVSA
jgi:HAD superfamily hydrolase (TIGR01450 family)